MELNKSTGLLLRDVYSYDISSCHYNILDRFGYDLSNIEREDKLKRNTQIGLMMKDNPNITSLLRNTTESLISDYIFKNNITDADLIVRQYDGLIVSKQMKITDVHMPLELRDKFEYMLLSIDRKMYIALTEFTNKVTVKGVPHIYPAMIKIYKKLIKTNFGSKSAVFRSLQRIKEEILYTKDSSLFAIPTIKGKCNIFFKYYGEVQVSLGMIKILDASDIDRDKYYDFYIRPFAESLIIEFA